MENRLTNWLSQMKELIDNFDYNTFFKIVESIKEVKEKNKKVFLVGNGGSSSIATHFAADLFKTSDKKIRAISLVENIPLMTAIINDLSFDDLYEYQLKVLGESGDLLIAFSVHGGGKFSNNLIKAIRYAKQNGIKTIGIAAFDGGLMKNECDIFYHIKINSTLHAESFMSFLCHLVTFYLKEV